MFNLGLTGIIQTLVTAMILCLSAGCLREDRSGCSEGVLLKFRYVTLNGLPLSPGFPEIDHLSVFIFDGNGLFICEQQDSTIQITDNYTMRLPFYEGQYQFVVWAGLSDCFQVTSCIPQQTPIQEFGLTLKQEADNTISTSPDLLYQGWHKTVTLYPSQTEEITIGLKRMTNTIQVIVHTTNPEAPPLISIWDNNGTYNHQGEIVVDQTIKYLPYYTHSSGDSGTWIADFNVMLLQADSDARLTINSAEGKRIYDEKLISGLLQANPDINFNIDHDFTIEITFNSYYVPISILINGWEIIPEEVN